MNLITILIGLIGGLGLGALIGLLRTKFLVRQKKEEELFQAIRGIHEIHHEAINEIVRHLRNLARHSDYIRSIEEGKGDKAPWTWRLSEEEALKDHRQSLVYYNSLEYLESRKRLDMDGFWENYYKIK